MNNITDNFFDAEHEAEATRVYEQWVSTSLNLTEEQREMFWNCLNLIHLARAFFAGCHDSQFRFDNLQSRLIYVGFLASSFRQVYLRIGKDRLGVDRPSHVSNAQALRELEACWQWMQKKGIYIGKVYAYKFNEALQRAEWYEVTPKVFVSKIFDAYRTGKAELLRKEAELEEKKKAKKQKRED